MFRLFTALLFLFIFTTFSSGGETPQIKWNSDGTLSAGGLVFRLVHAGRNWHFSEQNVNTVIPEEGFPVFTEKTFRLEGSFRLANGARFRIRETGTRSGGNAECSLALDNPEGIDGNAVYLRALLPAKDFLNQDILIDGQKYGFEEKYSREKDHFQFNHFVKTLVLPLKDGRLAVKGNFRCRLQDNRAWKRDVWELRIYPDPSWGVIKQAKLNLALSFESYRSTPIPLTDVSNMGFRDEKAEDRTGGWTDQGPENDLRMFLVGRQNFAGLPFEIVDPTKNNGKSCVVLKGSARPYFPESAEIVLKTPVKGKYLYLLHGVAWPAQKGAAVGSVQIESAKAQFVDKEIMTHEVVCGRDVENFWNPVRLDNGIIAWKASNQSSNVGLYVSRFELGENPVSKITLKSYGRSVWMIAGITVSDRLLNNAKDTSAVVKAGKDWVPLKNKKDILKGSILDFSFLLDAPAGKYGFLKNRNGRFEFENAPGKPVRFYGANTCYGASMMEHRLTDRMMDEFAATGYNLIRFHHFDHMLTYAKNGNSLNFHAWAMDRMDYLIAAAKKRGIYVTLDLYTMRKIQKGEIPGYPEQTLSGDDFKMMTFIDPGAMKNFQAFARTLLTHKNKYTGLAWKDDPAIAFLSLLNEDTIYKVGGGFVGICYEKKFQEWCRRKSLVPDNQARNSLWRKFLSETYRKAFAELRRFAEEIGIRAPVTDQNFRDTISVTLDRELYDYVDNHFYWGHPVGLGANPWRPPLYYIGDSSITRFGAITGKATKRLYAKPYTITEWNYVSPNPYAMEGAFLAGAYAAAQDWSGLCRFEYAGGPDQIKNEDHITGGFGIANCPVQLLSERAGILFFLRRDVQVSKKNYPLLLSRRHLDHGAGDAFPGLLDRFSLLGRTGTVIVDDNQLVSLPEGTEFAVAIGDVPCKLNVPVRAPEEAVRKLGLDRKKAFSNDTGELFIDSTETTFCVKTDRSEGFVLNPGQTLSGNFAEVSCKLTPAAVLVAAMDRSSLKDSSRYLLLHLTDVKNTGMKFRDSKMTILEDYGTIPQLIRRGEAEVLLRRNLRGFKLHAVDFNGKRLFEIPMAGRKHGTAFTLKNTGYGQVVCVYELVKE